MKPINAEETVRVFNGWLEEADSLAEREAIERCIDHIQDAPAVSQQELRSYMLPWFSPFAAPWCGKIQRAFPKAYVTMNFELILVPRTNTYINLNHCSTPDEFKAEVIEGVSRFAFKAFTKPLCKKHRPKTGRELYTKYYVCLYERTLRKGCGLASTYTHKRRPLNFCPECGRQLKKTKKEDET